MEDFEVEYCGMRPEPMERFAEYAKVKEKEMEELMDGEDKFKVSTDVQSLNNTEVFYWVGQATPVSGKYEGEATNGQSVFTAEATPGQDGEDFTPTHEVYPTQPPNSTASSAPETDRVSVPRSLVRSGALIDGSESSTTSGPSNSLVRTTIETDVVGLPSSLVTNLPTTEVMVAQVARRGLRGWFGWPWAG